MKIAPSTAVAVLPINQSYLAFAVYAFTTTQKTQPTPTVFQGHKGTCPVLVETASTRRIVALFRIESPAKSLSLIQT